MNKEQLQFFYDEIMGELGWEDGDEASGVDPLLWAKAEIGRTLEIVKEQRKRIMEFQVAEKDYVATLRAELDEWHNAAKFVADGCTDEIHCGCVPILKRELDAANKAVDEARKGISKAHDHLAHASFDYSNGNVDSTGRIDEGNVYGWPAHDAVLTELAVWLTAHPEGKEA